MPGIRARHLTGVLAVTVASGLLFSVSALNERRHPAATSDLSTLVRTRQEQVRQLETEVSSLDAAIEGFSPAQSGTAAEDAFTASRSRCPTLPPARSPREPPPMTSSSTSRTSRTP